MIATGRQYKSTIKNKIYLKLYKVFTSWGQWFINHCDMESLNLCPSCGGSGVKNDKPCHWCKTDLFGRVIEDV